MSSAPGQVGPPGQVSPPGRHDDDQLGRGWLDGRVGWLIGAAALLVAFVLVVGGFAMADRRPDRPPAITTVTG